MFFPTVGQYAEVIKLVAGSPEDYFCQLSNLRPVLDAHGEPVMSSGNFAVVFKMVDDNGNFHALKCFIREQQGRATAYRQISDTLATIDSPYLTATQYYEKELYVDTSQSDETEFPVLLMDWVEGQTLDKYLRANLGNKNALQRLAFRFCQLTQWLLPQPFAHGDLKPDNILVRGDGSLVLIDYDGMYVPAMLGQKSREMGSPDFRHPLRTEDNFDERIDDFPAMSILFSLLLLAHTPELLERYGASDRLLFSETDYRSISECALLKEHFPTEDAVLNRIGGLFLIALSDVKLPQPLSADLLNLPEPAALKPAAIVSTEATEEDWKNAVEDEYGVKYSVDWKKLLDASQIKINKIHDNYFVRDGTEIICDFAFWKSHLYPTITLPDSLIGIGKGFGRYVCYNYSGQKLVRLIHVKSKSPRFVVERGLLIDLLGQRLISYVGKDTDVTLPDSIKHIGDYAFYKCESIHHVCLPKTIISIGNYAFYKCTDLWSIGLAKTEKEWNTSRYNTHPYGLPDSLISIGNYAFYRCKELSIHLSTINCSITSIGDYAFYGCCKSGSFTLPNTITHIGKAAFNGNWKMPIIENSSRFLVDNGLLIDIMEHRLISYAGNDESITLPANITHIGERAFCKGIIPDSITDIENHAFPDFDTFDFYSLQEIILPNSLTKIGDGAFYHCGNLQHINLPNSLVSIGNSAFEKCSWLNSITLPESLTNIGERAFKECGAANMKSKSNRFVVKNDFLIDELEHLLISYLGAEESISPPNSITHIGEYAFCNKHNNHIKNITLPDSITHIGNHAFSKCVSLIEITLPNSIISIGTHAFSGCSQLRHITLPNSLSIIEDSLFENCSSLQQVNLPDSITRIGNHAFSNCNHLERITLPNSLSVIEDSLFEKCSSLQQVDLPDSITRIGIDAFSNCGNLEHITLPNSLNSIGDYAFFQCIGLKQITLPDSISSIGKGSFLECWEYDFIQEIKLPNSLARIGDKAFYGNSSFGGIQESILPDSLTSIGEDAFFWKTKLKSKSQRFIIENDLLIDMLEHRLISYRGKEEKTISLPDTITTIGKRAFQYCTSLQQISLPNSVTTIEDQAFEYCRSLQQINLPNSLVSLGDYVFHECYSLEVIDLPKSLSVIGDYVFKKCSLQRVSLPESLTNIGKHAFSDCRLTLISNSNRFVVENGLLIDMLEHRLVSYVGDEKSISLPNSITHIGEYAFCNKHIQNITLPDSITHIEDHAFVSCDLYHSIILPNSITYIGDAAFSGCEFEQIILPNSLVSIGDKAFSHCRRLKTVSFPNSIKSIGDSVFVGFERDRDDNYYDIMNITKIVIPKGSRNKFNQLLPLYLHRKIVEE